ncbi:MAG TPA: hypothetical protein VF133_00235 [Terriglobales bacterium]
MTTAEISSRKPETPQPSETPMAGMIRRAELEALLEMFFALDRTVVEFFMQVYGVSQRDRVAMLKHNRRLHAAVRRHRRSG